MKEIKPQHKHLYTMMTWKMSKLLSKLANCQDESTLCGIESGKRMITQAKDYLKESKQKGGYDHPKDYKIEDLEEKLAETSSVLTARRGLMQANTFIEKAEKYEECG